MIGHVPSEFDAKRFSDYLLTRGIPAHVEPSSDQSWQVWIEHDDHLEQGENELRAFLNDPSHPRYDQSSVEADRIRKRSQQQALRRRQNYHDVRTQNSYSTWISRPTPVAILLIAVSIVVYLFQWYDNKQRYQRTEYWLLFQSRLVEYESFDGTAVVAEPDPSVSVYDQILRGQVWRAFTPMFLHFGVLHILFNMMWVWQLGRVIEAMKGSLFFLLLVLGVALVSNNAQALWDQYVAGMRGFGGMSGVVAGLFGYAWMKSRFQPYQGLRIPDQMVGLMLGWLVICSLGWVGPIANAAHWGGLIAGMVMGFFPTLLNRLRQNH
jgi:GlpG protein